MTETQVTVSMTNVLKMSLDVGKEHHVSEHPSQTETRQVLRNSGL